MLPYMSSVVFKKSIKKKCIFFLCEGLVILLGFTEEIPFKHFLFINITQFRFLLFFSDQIIKGATKSWFTHYSFVVIVLFNTVLCRCTYSTVSFRKLVFRLSVHSLKEDIKICVIMICSFVLTIYKNSPFINNKLFAKALQYYVKTCFQKCFAFFKKIANSFIKKGVE